MPKKLSKPFLIILVVASLIACYFVFQSFLTELVIAAVLATIFYKPFEQLAAFLGNRRNLAALMMCLFLLAILIIPSIQLIGYTSEKSIQAYSETTAYFSNHNLSDVFKSSLFQRLNFLNVNFDNDLVKNSLLDFLKKSSDWMISGATSVIVNTTGFLASLVMIILTMFFFFVDGKNMLEKLMHLSPLEDK
ncbi:MAG: AI-2E family transporter, partial [Patescibacteria group bacterium]